MKDRDQDLALLALERITQRTDEWKISHQQVHKIEAETRDQLRNTMNTRLDAMNEFRDALKDAQARMLTRDTYEREHTSLSSRLSNVERLLPLVAILSAGISAAITAAIVRAFGG